MSRELLGKRLRLARHERRLTQQRLADLAHVTQAQIQKIENGKSRHPRNLLAIAKVLDVTEAWLTFGCTCSFERSLDEPNEEQIHSSPHIH